MAIQMAFILFDDMTTLDFAGFHNAVTWLSKRGYRDDLTWHYCADKSEITDDRGMVVKADRVLPDLSEYDLVFVPGGAGTRRVINSETFMEWIQGAKEVSYKISVCTGALIYGAAGFLHDRTVTTNPLALELLEPHCKEVIRCRAMRDGGFFTGGGITASIDLGLYFVETITSAEIASEIALLMDYPYYAVSPSP
ncbi:DJ-1/PfpI family protein [Paenibacillus xylaniclasticus]|uniref:DJ-1/PfpI family protein n=1 Tax=Paenibacillus xylaniclasticus TaxID=588083 RepID=UPI001771CAD0|nr:MULTISPECIES: DJ-1/PfpI family protein [Paenibacillus]GFN32902.1 glutamine amidotransferase [Paenibacillus curdlanolyticus]